MLIQTWYLTAPATAAQDSAGRRVLVTIAPSAGAESANCPVVAGGRVGPDSMGGVVRRSNAAAGAWPPSPEDAFTGMNCEMTGPVTPPPPVVKTWNSHSEYPKPVARAVPYIRTYRPVPLTVSVCVPPVPVVVA